MEHVRPDVPRAGCLAREEHLPEAGEAVRVVQLVAVEAEGPQVLARPLLDQVVRLAGLLHAVERRRDGALGGQPLEDLRRRVARAVVDEDELVAEPEDVPHCPLDEPVLVPKEPDPDDLRHAVWGASVRQILTSSCASRARCSVEMKPGTATVVGSPWAYLLSFHHDSGSRPSTETATRCRRERFRRSGMLGRVTWPGRCRLVRLRKQKCKERKEGRAQGASSRGQQGAAPGTGRRWVVGPPRE